MTWVVSIRDRVITRLPYNTADYFVAEWNRRANVKAYSDTLKDVEVPTGARYILIFSTDAQGTPLAPPVGFPVTGWDNKYTRREYLTPDTTGQLDIHLLT